MPRGAKYNWVSAAAILLISAGCTTDQVRVHEQRGEHHKAYELCRQALAVNPRDQAAASGLRRNAPAALAYWSEQAVAAAMRRDWRRAALCHRQVLEIKPDEKGSIDALRQLAQQHPDQVRLAAVPSAAAAPPSAKPALQIAAGPPAASVEPAASGSSEAPAPPPGVPAISGTAATAPPSPSPMPRTAGKAAGATPSTAPAGRPAATRPPLAAEPPPRVPVAGGSDPHRQKPTVRRERGASEAEVAMIVYVSRENPRYPKRALLTDGLSVKVKDTDPAPLDADLEVYLSNRRVGKFADLPIGSVLTVLGRSLRPYDLILMHIEDDTETVKIGLRRSGGTE